MRHLSLALSATALVVALLGSTAVGPASAELAAKVVPFAKVAQKASVADNAKRLNGRRSSLKGTANTIPILGADGNGRYSPHRAVLASVWIGSEPHTSGRGQLEELRSGSACRPGSVLPKQGRPSICDDRCRPPGAIYPDARAGRPRTHPV